METGTVRELFDRNKGVAPGFDALRLILSCSVLLVHSFPVCYGTYDNVQKAVRGVFPAAEPLVRAILPMFFFLGGFLVTGSAYRLKNVKTFLLFRGLRILPALLVEVTLSALVLGALVTRLPLREYYTSHEFFTYFLNIIGMVQFTLPGVFKDNPIDMVNGNLWTLPPDFHGYALMAVLIATGVIFNRRAFLAVFALANAFLLVLLPAAGNWGRAEGHIRIIPVLLVYSFFLGAFAYVYADKVRIRKAYMAISVLMLVFFCWKYTTLLGLWGACYLTLCIGFLRLENFPLAKRGDYSYGIYLYGMPIQQGLWHYVPSVRTWWKMDIAALAATLCFAVLSWHCIEKPFLNLKRRINA